MITNDTEQLTYNTEPQKSVSTTTDNSVEVKQQPPKRFRCLETTRQEDEDNITNIGELELQQYLCNVRCYIKSLKPDTDVLEFWKSNCSQYPNLSN